MNNQRFEFEVARLETELTPRLRKLLRAINIRFRGPDSFHENVLLPDGATVATSDPVINHRLFNKDNL